MPQRTFEDGYLVGWRWVRGDDQVRSRRTPNIGLIGVCTESPSRSDSIPVPPRGWMSAGR